MKEQPNELLKVADICKHLKLPSDKIDQVISYISAYMPSNKADRLPRMLKSGVNIIDVLIAPFTNNTRLHIFGPAGTGKTSLIVHMCESITSNYKSRVLWIDSSYKLNAKFFRKFRLSDRLDFFQSTSITHDILKVIQSEKYRVVVLDDIASIEDNFKYFKLLHLAKIHHILIIGANQIRIDPKHESIISAKGELTKDFDMTLGITTYQKHTDDGYNDFNLKLTYHHLHGVMKDKSVVVPITTSGFLKQELCDKRVNSLIKEMGFNSIYDLLKERGMEEHEKQPDTSSDISITNPIQNSKRGDQGKESQMQREETEAQTNNM